MANEDVVNIPNEDNMGVFRGTTNRLSRSISSGRSNIKRLTQTQESIDKAKEDAELQKQEQIFASSIVAINKTITTLETDVRKELETVEPDSSRELELKAIIKEIHDNNLLLNRLSDDKKKLTDNEYDQAITTFRKIDSLVDSVDGLTLSNDAINEARRQNALAEIKSGDNKKIIDLLGESQKFQAVEFKESKIQGRSGTVKGTLASTVGTTLLSVALGDVGTTIAESISSDYAQEKISRGTDYLSQKFTKFRRDAKTNDRLNSLMSKVSGGRLGKTNVDADKTATDVDKSQNVITNVTDASQETNDTTQQDSKVTNVTQPVTSISTTNINDSVTTSNQQSSLLDRAVPPSVKEEKAASDVAEDKPKSNRGRPKGSKGKKRVGASLPQEVIILNSGDKKDRQDVNAILRTSGTPLETTVVDNNINSIDTTSNESKVLNTNIKGTADALDVVITKDNTNKDDNSDLLQALGKLQNGVEMIPSVVQMNGATDRQQARRFYNLNVNTTKENRASDRQFQEKLQKDEFKFLGKKFNVLGAKSGGGGILSAIAGLAGTIATALGFKSLLGLGKKVPDVSGTGKKPTVKPNVKPTVKPLGGASKAAGLLKGASKIPVLGAVLAGGATALGDIGRTDISKEEKVGRAVGSGGGAAAGAATGAAVGFAVGGPVGAFIGGVIGGIGGSEAGKRIGGAVGDIVGGPSDDDLKDRKKIKSTLDGILERTKAKIKARKEAEQQKDKDIKLLEDDAIGLVTDTKPDVVSTAVDTNITKAKMDTKGSKIVYLNVNGTTGDKPSNIPIESKESKIIAKTNVIAENVVVQNNNTTTSTTTANETVTKAQTVKSGKVFENVERGTMPNNQPIVVGAEENRVVKMETGNSRLPKSSAPPNSTMADAVFMPDNLGLILVNGKVL